MLVGDELLSAKIRDENGYFLAQRMRARGVELVEICTVPDDHARIGQTLLRLLDMAEVVFTSGGVGPTHDDITIESIGMALDRPVERHAELEATLRKFYKGELNAAALRMADAPAGTRLVAEQGWPVLRVDLPANEGDAKGREHDARIYILPGVPGLLAAKVEALEAIDGELPRGPGYELVDLNLRADESQFANELREVNRLHPQVAIGSYPRWHRDDEGRVQVNVRLTFEADEAALAAAARDAFLAQVDPAIVA